MTARGVTVNDEPKRSFFHPASGLAILAIDWLFFGLEWEMGPVSLAMGCLGSFGLCYAVVKRIQTRWHGDEPRAAAAKALLGALAAGAPFCVGGTLLGGWILVLSGLKASRLLNTPRKP